jgi:hypothetical protein
MMGSQVVLDHCTIVGNGGWALRGAYYTSPQIRDSVIVGNRGGGIWIRHYECKPTMNNSVMYGNGKMDIVCEVSFDWDFTKNYWGKRVTTVLQTKGVGVTLPTIADGKVKQGVGKVRLDEFLKEIPDGVGASIRQVRGKAIAWRE